MSATIEQPSGRVHLTLEGMTEDDERKLLDDHVNGFVADGLAAGDRDVAKQKRDEVLAAVERFASTR